MTRPIDESHDPALRSWVESANHPDSDFPIQNLPFGVFTPRGATGPGRIGDRHRRPGAGCVRCARTRPAAGPAGGAAGGAGGADAERPHGARRAGDADTAASSRPPVESRQLHGLNRRALVAMTDVEMGVPATIGDYTDFYASVLPRHARRAAVPPRQSAAAELQVRADRLPRSRLLDRGERHGGSPAVGTDQGAGPARTGVSPDAHARLRARGRRVRRAAATRWARRSRSRTPKTTSSVSAC